MPTISIWGRLKGHKPELIDTASTKAQAECRAREYRIAFGKDWKIWIGRKDSEPK